jgi:inner membrane protein
MASAFSHAIAAGALGAAFYRPGWPGRFWILGAVCAVLPDADVLGVHVGIPFEGAMGHRGLSHSLLFAAGLAAVVVALGFRRAPEGVSHARLWLYFFLATASHGVLDAITNGGPGIAFFAPLDDTRYFFPFRPVLVSPIGIRAFFSEWGWRVIQTELVWIWLPALAFVGLSSLVRRRAGGPD